MSSQHRHELFNALRWLVDTTPRQQQDHVVGALLTRLGPLGAVDLGGDHLALVRHALEPHLAAVAATHGENEEAVRRFGRLLLNLGPGARPQTGWQRAAEELHLQAFASKAAWPSIARNLRRSPPAIGGAAKLLEGLVDRLVQSEVSRPHRRSWLYHREPGGAVEAGSPRLTIVTAHHGVSLQGSLTRYLDYLDRIRQPKPALINLERRHLVPIARPYVERHLPDSDAKELGDDDPKLFRLVFSLPRRILNMIWSKTFREAVWPELTARLRGGEDVLLSFSASWYHDLSGSISPAINLGAVADLVATARRDNDLAVTEAFRTARVITLLDDSYDCLARLTVDHEVFDPLIAVGEVPSASSAIRILLDWRQQEVGAAEELARLLGVPHRLVAVKHPLHTVHKVVVGKPTAYLSHAVVMPRARAEAGGPDERPVVRALAERLSQHDDFALIEPVTIDERRFVTAFRTDVPGRTNVKHVLRQGLEARWIPLEDFDREPAHHLYTPLDPEQRRLAEQPFLASGSRWSWWQAETPRSLDNVWSEAVRQTRWRWRLLVNQCDEALFVYRPFDREELRRIGEEELTLWQSLRNHEIEGADFRAAPTARRILVVYHTAADEQARRVNAVAKFIEAQAHGGTFEGQIPPVAEVAVLFDRQGDRFRPLLENPDLLAREVLAALGTRLMTDRSNAHQRGTDLDKRAGRFGRGLASQWKGPMAGHGSGFSSASSFEHALWVSDADLADGPSDQGSLGIRIADAMLSRYEAAG